MSSFFIHTGLKAEVSCVIHQQHRPQCFVISHFKCQSSTVSDRPRPELVSDTRDPASRPIFDSQLSGILGGHESREMKFGVSRCMSSIVWCARWAKPKATNKCFSKKYIPPCTLAPVDAQNSAIPGAVPKMGEDLSEMWLNRHAKFYAGRWSPGWEIRNRT